MKLDQALTLVKKYVTNENLLKHMIATQACMKRLACHLGANEETWQLSGLLHDIDYEKTRSDPSKHGYVSAQILKDYGLGEEVLHAIVAHAGWVERKSMIDSALYSVDPLTGLIVASALMHPSKKLKKLNVEFVLRRFKEKRFAQGANREQIKKCSELGLSLEEFIALCLEGMTEVSSELGL